MDSLVLVAEHFQIDDGDDIDALFLDNHGVELPETKFNAVVKQFSNCGAFFVEIELLNRPNTSSAQVKFILIQPINWEVFLVINNFIFYVL